MGIEKIDKNFKIDSQLSDADIVWYNAKDDIFDIYGLYQPHMAGGFCRLPDDVVKNCNEGVGHLQKNTAGARLRFKTDSEYICLKVKYNLHMMPHMPLTGSAGFDLYSQRDGKHTFLKGFTPRPTDTNGFERKVDTPHGLCDYIINFPLYMNVDELYIGFKEGSTVQSGEKYTIDKPVVYYGSSITQGGCASRPGTAYQAFISRRFDADFINLGFSGSGKGDSALAEYIAGLEMSAFVYDYDHNAPSAEHYKATHEPFFKIIRKAQPNLPIIFVTAPFPCRPTYTEIARTTYNNAVAAGDKNVTFIDGADFFVGELKTNCTVDGLHPTDLGFYQMSRLIGDALEKYIVK